MPVGTVNNQTSNPVSVTQRDLIELAKLGSPSAIKQLVEFSQPKLYGMIFNMVHNHEDTEDLVQESYRKAFRAIDGFNGDSSFNTWIHRIAYNCTINYIRKKKKTYNLSIDDTNSGVTHDTDFIEQTTTSGADRSLLIAELGAAIKEAMSKLSTSHRQVVQLFDIDGLSHRDIASQLGVKECTVRTRLFYAHRQLQSMLTEYKELI